MAHGPSPGIPQQATRHVPHDQHDGAEPRLSVACGDGALCRREEMGERMTDERTAMREDPPASAMPCVQTQPGTRRGGGETRRPLSTLLPPGTSGAPC